MQSSRDQRLLIAAGIVGLVVGGLAGIAGGLLVATGKIGPFTSYLPKVAMESHDESDDVIGDVGRGSFSEESSTVAVVRSASPAVVSIVVRKDMRNVPRGNFFNFDNFFEFGIPFTPKDNGDAKDAPQKQQIGGGSGFIVTSDGYIVTNRHVVADEDAEFSVVLNDDREFPAKVLARDPIHDVAILKVAVDEILPTLPLGDSDTIQTGETVIAIGYALSEYRNTVTRGVISGINRRVVAGNGFGQSEVIYEAIQTDAAINPGNSGGPLLNLNGEVIGVNTAVSQEGQLVGFAIPVNLAKQAVESVVAEGRIVRPWLGVRYVMVNKQLAADENLPVSYGAMIVRGATPNDVAIVIDSPADKAGLAIRDLIIAVDGKRVDEDMPLASHIAKKKTGDTIKLTVLRDGKERTIEAKLGEFPGE